MGVSKKHKGKITNDNLNEWMASLGFLYPQNELQLDRFTKFYEDYDFKLSDARIDVKAIVSENLKHKPVVIDFTPKQIATEITELKMVARKGASKIPEHILRKMKKNQDNSTKD